MDQNNAAVEAAFGRVFMGEPAVIEGLLCYDGVIIGQRALLAPHISCWVGLLAGVVLYSMFFSLRCFLVLALN